MPKSTPIVQAIDLHAWLRRREAIYLSLLKRLVESESPSAEKPAVDRMGALLASECKRRGAQVRILRQRKTGNHIRAEFQLAERKISGQLLILGHLDTVYPRGTLQRMPFRIANGRAWGPGTFDMKGGLVLALAAIDALRALHIHPHKRIVSLFTSDEETGSGTSRRAIETEARRSDAVFVLEPALGPDGRLKTGRKGVGEVELIVTGRSAHAGIDPESGVNAVHELALQIAKILRFNNPRLGITVQANIISGGSATNVVADSARARIDLRVAHAADIPALVRKLHALRPIHKGAKIEVRGGMNRPPLERTTAIRSLFLRAQSIAGDLGFSLNEASTGGGSDGNFTAALGVPTLDGLGAVGAGAHSPREHIVIAALSQRAALLAALLATF